MSKSDPNIENSWNFLVGGQFQEFDEFSEAVHGWDADFHQLKPGYSPTSVTQFGSERFLVTQFQAKLPLDQHGSTPPGMLTMGFINKGSGIVSTPSGVVTEEAMWCFSPGNEFNCTSRSDWNAYGLSISESFLNEVAEACGLADTCTSLGANQVICFHDPGNLNKIRNEITLIHRYLESSERSSRFSLQQALELEFDLAQQIVEALSQPLDVKQLRMTHRRQLVLRRALDYLAANPQSPVTVRELSEAIGAGIRLTEYVFKDYFGVAPKTYMTIRRLIGAHRELQHFDPESTTIQDIAFKWGFWHLGRFSAVYRQFFGEMPSQTLRKTA